MNFKTPNYLIIALSLVKGTPLKAWSLLTKEFRIYLGRPKGNNHSSIILNKCYTVVLV